MAKTKVQTSLPAVQNALQQLIDQNISMCELLASTLVGASEKRGQALEQSIQQTVSETKRLQEMQNEAKHSFARLIRSLDKEINELASRGFSFQRLYEFGLAVNAEYDLEKMMKLGMEAAIEMTNAKRGYVALVDAGGSIQFVVAKKIEEEDSSQAFEISKTIVQEVIRTKAPVEIEDAMQNEELKAMQSVVGFRLRSVLCMPLEAGGEVIGVIYLDNKEQGGIFTKESSALLQAFSRQMAMAVQTNIALKNAMTTNDQLMEALRTKYAFENIIGKSEKLRTVLESVAQVADTNATVLIYGESGTGKELIAHALHFNSHRRSKPFIAINTGAIPEHLLESELFGYEKGAFTGAMNAKPGKFELADGGTIFLDEIGDMPLAMQVKLLRVLQSRSVERLGGTKSIPIDVRIVAATHRDLEAFVKEEKFREDLFYRLNVFNVLIPPLRERKEDIPLLANYFLKSFSEREKKAIQSISRPAMESLEQFDWRGNARELENTIERAVIVCAEQQIENAHLPKHIAKEAEPESKEHNSFNDAVNEHKKTLIVKALQETGNHKTEAAKKLGLSRSYFYTLLSELGIQ